MLHFPQVVCYGSNLSSRSQNLGHVSINVGAGHSSFWNLNSNVPGVTHMSSSRAMKKLLKVLLSEVTTAPMHWVLS